MALSMDLRTRIVAAYENGEGTYVEVARRFCVDKTTVYRLLQRKRETGSVAPRRGPRGKPTTFQGERLEALRTLVEEDPDVLEVQLVERLAQRFDIHVCTSTVGNALRRHGWTRKKRRSALPRTTPQRDNTNEQPS